MDRELTGPEDLYSRVRKIPKGRIAAYGDLGRSLERPVSGLLVGRWMARAPEDIPWWRVIGKNGEVRLFNRDPKIAIEQLKRLSDDGVEIDDNRVSDLSAFLTLDELSSD